MAQKYSKIRLQNYPPGTHIVIRLVIISTPVPICRDDMFPSLEQAISLKAPSRFL
jgi:hypothetical protein